ncbi:MAG TPA: hypothetical protein VHB27_22385 [Rhodopila sp.]|uniref:hypothetical protein n=1 Tax=Rhodopila sp. TaxID=2480087 RepID=UPI002BC76B90|nr:hypothetical protein [Rhodopila sp.]HVY17984.1 hypothetical protein [Rhodopila sp.]HWC00250.1 hypothetical protein [Bryobacteraceae bacterium]
MRAMQLEDSSVRGLSFSVPDLVLLKSWAKAQALNMRVHLDYVSDGKEYDEILAFHAGENSLFEFIMWRDARSVYVKPVMGWPQRFRSVMSALSAICPDRDEPISDITAKTWPQS